MILSIDEEKASDKIQHVFLIKTLKKVCIEGTYLNIIKATHERTTVNIILNGEKLKAFPLRSGTRQGCLCSPFLFSSPGSPRHSNETTKRKGIQMGKEEAFSLFVDDMILYIENLKDSTKKTA